MCESVDVLVLIDDVNKIYYTEQKEFGAGSEEAKLARLKYLALLKKAKENGYQVIRREKNITPMDDGDMSKIDERIDRHGRRPR